MDKKAILAFSKGADMNTDDGAELEFSAPKNLRRPTTVLNQRIMAPYLIDSPPWLKADALPVPEPLHHYYMAESYVASISYDRALSELEKAIELDPKNPRFYLLQAKIYLEQDKSSEAAKAASREAEKELILQVLTRTRWNRRRAAQELQISYKALLYKLKQIGYQEYGA